MLVQLNILFSALVHVHLFLKGINFLLLSLCDVVSAILIAYQVIHIQIVSVNFLPEALFVDDAHGRN